MNNIAADAICIINFNAEDGRIERKRSTKLGKWRTKYGTIVIALSCFGGLVISWGINWILTGILVLGVLICGTIGIFDIKRSIVEENNQV